MSNATLPRLAEGIVDWKQVFDTPGTGLVAKIEHARSAEDLQNAFRLILKTLFNREGDEERRAVFTNLVNEILSHAAKSNKSPASAMADVKLRVIQILHSIKDDRIKRAQKALMAKARKAEQERLQGTPSTEPEPLGFVDRQSDDVHIAVPHETTPPAGGTSSEPATDMPAEASATEPPTSENPAAEQPNMEPDLELSEVQKSGDKSVGDFDDWLSTPHSTEAVKEYEDTGGAEKKTPEAFFIDVITSSIMDNMAELRGNLTDGGASGNKLPFVLSPAFAERFEQVLRLHILPDFAESSYFNISQMSAKPRKKWLDILTATMTDKTQGLMLWERWQIAWRNAIEQREEPEMPAPDPKKQGVRGFMTKLLGDDDYLYPEEEMTKEEWEEIVQATREENARAKKTWSLLSAPSDDFVPPQDNDSDLLMALFKSLDDINIHMEQFLRFAKDEEKAGRNFDSYLPGKDLDLALLCVCLRHPDVFMSGEKTMVATFVAGLDRKRAEAVLPLCCRFLGTAMGNRFAD